MKPLLLLAIGVALAGATASRAQQPINASNAATVPSPGTFLLEEQFRFESLKLEHGPEQRQGRIRDYGLFNNLNWGLVRDVSLSLRVPVRLRDRDAREGGGTDLGVGDVTILGKWRFWKHDTSALDTQRLALTGGVDIPSGDDPFTSNSFNPIVGLAYTRIAGRNGINAALQYTFTTNGSDEPILPGESRADLLRYDAAYLYRLAPAAYTVETAGAWYAVLELNGYYETNGDNELRLSPGVMYEAWRWALELSVQVPVWRDIAHRAATELILVCGLRFVF